jgi:hypothetical protein
VKNVKFFLRETARNRMSALLFRIKEVLCSSLSQEAPYQGLPRFFSVSPIKIGLGHDRFLPYPSQFVDHRVILRYAGLQSALMTE